jgi:voltage-gated potassium channel
MAEHRDPLEVGDTPDWWSWMMIILSVLFLIGYSLLALRPDLSTASLSWVLLIMIVIWVLFIVEFIIAFVRAKEGWRFITKHWLVALSIVLPVVRPFLLLRYLNQLAYFRRGTGNAVRAQLIITALAFATLFIYMISLTVLRFERDAPGATIVSFGDAIWWAFVTIATVGYGDMYPITIPGRFFAVVLMLGGIAIVGTASALVVSYLGEHTQKALKKTAQEPVVNDPIEDAPTSI